MAYPLCKLKNISEQVWTVNGKEFAVDELYTLPDLDRLSWANSDDAIVDIVNENLQVHDADGPIVSIADQIKLLQDY